MRRIFVLPALVLLMAQASLAMAQVTSIKVEGQLADGNVVTATCSVGNNGQITGTGALSGKNSVTGAMYSYPFVISKGVTAQGKLVLTGKMVAGPAMTLSATSPNGAVVFSYVINGKTYSYAGQGTISVK